MTDNKLNLINKLKRLMESDNPNEAKSAEEKLHKIMEKYNIKESELNELQVNEYKLYYHNELENKLLTQICYKVFGKEYGNKCFQKRYHRGKRIELILKCTYEEYLEVSIQYDFYKEFMKEELDIFYRAFLYKHNIFPSDVEATDPPEEDLDNIRRAIQMMKGMQDKSYVQRIGDMTNE